MNEWIYEMIVRKSPDSLVHQAVVNDDGLSASTVIAQFGARRNGRLAWVANAQRGSVASVSADAQRSVVIYQRAFPCVGMRQEGDCIMFTCVCFVNIRTGCMCKMDEV